MHGRGTVTKRFFWRTMRAHFILHLLAVVSLPALAHLETKCDGPKGDWSLGARFDPPEGTVLPWISRHHVVSVKVSQEVPEELVDRMCQVLPSGQCVLGFSRRAAFFSPEGRGGGAGFSQ